MTVKQFTLGVAAAGFMALGSAASASMLTLIDDGNVDSMVIANNDLLGGILNGQTVDFITGDVKSALNGLNLSGGPSRVTFTYLGFEAGNSNFSARAGGNMFVNGVASVGDQSVYQPVADGLVDFSFGTTAPESFVGEIFNDGGAVPADSAYSIGYIGISDTSFYLLFDDIFEGDRDFDDIGLRIDVERVPVPAGILLMGTALAGFGVMRRRKK